MQTNTLLGRVSDPESSKFTNLVVLAPNLARFPPFANKLAKRREDFNTIKSKYSLCCICEFNGVYIFSSLGNCKTGMICFC